MPPAEQDEVWGRGADRGAAAACRGPALCWRRRGQRVTDLVHRGGGLLPSSQSAVVRSGVGALRQHVCFPVWNPDRLKI